MKKGSILLKRYYWQICRRLSCPLVRKRRIIDNIRSGVEIFLEENPEADMSAVTDRFGTSEQIAESHLNEMDTKELQKSLNTQKRVLGVLITAVAAVLSIWLIAVIVASVHEWWAADNYYEVVVYEGEEYIIGTED